LTHEPDRTRACDLARRCGERSRRDLRERRFAGSVFAAERVDLTRDDLEIDIVDRARRVVRLDDAAQLERRSRHRARA